MILEYLKVFLSWPVVTAAIVFWIVHCFKTEIREFIKRLKRLSGFGGELEASAVPEQQEAPPASPPDGTSLGAGSLDPVQIRKDIENAWTVARFEAGLNRIFGSQLRFLISLNQQGDAGLALLNASPYYEEHRQAAGPNASSFAHYFGFLTGSAFIRTEGEFGPTQKVFITPVGRNFLDYITRNYIPVPFRPG